MARRVVPVAAAEARRLAGGRGGRLLPRGRARHADCRLTDVSEVLLYDSSYLGWSQRAHAVPDRFAHWPADVLERIGAPA